jgi:hypothetical protein
MLALSAALVILTVLFRTLYSGWAPPADIPAAATTVYGLAAYPADNLSYVTWAEQARHGRWIFDILYTTTAHARLFFNPLFLLVGVLSAALSVSPILVINLVAAFSMPVVLLAMWTMGRSLGLTPGATVVAAGLAIGGAGISWIRRILAWLDVNTLLVGPAGPDMSFYDVFPVVAYFIAPYHAISLALLAVLVTLVVVLDRPHTRSGTGRLAGLALMGTLVATIRPHTAIVVLLAIAVTLAATAYVDGRSLLLRRRAVVAGVVAAAMAPPVLYALWISSQPVWSDYANTHPPDTFDWVAGFFFLWIFGAAGMFLIGVQRLVRSQFAFLGVWAAGAFSLLIALNGAIYPKLTFGFTMALALIAATVWDRLAASVRPALSLAGGLVVGVLALASPTMLLADLARTAPAMIYSDLLKSIDVLREDSSDPFPTVLTDCGTGVLLPGLGGARVFCGHWALTDGNRRKIVALARLGFMADTEAVPDLPDVSDGDVMSSLAQLRKQIQEDRFSYIVVRTRHRLYRQLQGVEDCTLHAGDQYVVLRLCPPAKTLLAGLASGDALAAPQAERSN